MKSFEELVQEAAKQLGDPAYICTERMLRAIGYALLALAVAVKEKKE